MIQNILIIVLRVVGGYWWIIVPFLLWRPFLFFLLRSRQEKFGRQQKYIMLDVKMPQEILRPIKAMEQVFAGWWMIYDPPDWWEKWIDGKYQLSMAIEIVSNGGDIHFYLRVPSPARNFIESSLYAQYPDVEISIVDDYTKNIPYNIPTEGWDLWGCDYELTKKDVYPIKTYSRFFEESEALKEEKRIDPLASLLEGMAKLQPGEQMWVQFRITPVTNGDNNYQDRAKAIKDKLLFRPEKKPEKKLPMIKEAADVVLFGPQEPKKEEKQELFPPESKLSPGEKEVVAGVEDKVSKTMFECGIRFIFLGKKGVFHKPNLKNVLSFFANFNTENLNAFKPWGASITKIHKHENFFFDYFLHDSLLYSKKRRIFKNYLRRVDYYFPLNEKRFILNIEELATIFHLIGRDLVPAPLIRRIESKKSEPPPNLPMV